MSAPVFSVISSSPNPLLNPPTTIGGGNTAEVSKVCHLVPWDAITLKAGYCNYTVPSDGAGAAGETAVGNPIGVRCWFVNWEGTVHQAKFSGAAYVVIHDLSGPVWTDPVNMGAMYRTNPVTGSPGRYWVVTEVTTLDPVTLLPSATALRPTGFRTLSNPNQDNFNLMKEGVLAGTWDGEASIPTNVTTDVYSPSVVMAVARDNALKPSIGATGDSLIAGTGDTGYRNGLGSTVVRFASHQFNPGFTDQVSPDYGCVAVARGGALLATMLNPNAWKIRKTLALLCTHVFCNAGTNDDDTVLLANTKLNRIAFAKMVSDAGKVAVMLPLCPRSTSTDGWSTGASQTLITSLVAGGITKEVYHSTLRSWDADLTATGFLAQAVAAGCVASRVFAPNCSAAISADAAGAQSALGSYWLPKQATILTATVTAGVPTVASVYASALAGTGNSYRGYGIQMTSTYEGPATPYDGGVGSHQTFDPRNSPMVLRCVSPTLSGLVYTNTFSGPNASPKFWDNAGTVAATPGVPAAFAPGATWNAAWNATGTTLSVGSWNTLDGTHCISPGYALCAKWLYDNRESIGFIPSGGI